MLGQFNAKPLGQNATDTVVGKADEEVSNFKQGSLTPCAFSEMMCCLT